MGVSYIFDQTGVINANIAFPGVPNLYILYVSNVKLEKIGGTQHIGF